MRRIECTVPGTCPCPRNLFPEPPAVPGPLVARYFCLCCKFEVSLSQSYFVCFYAIAIGDQTPHASAQRIILLINLILLMLAPSYFRLRHSDSILKRELV